MIENWKIPEKLRQEYLDFIKLCLVDENEFDNFKRNSAIKVIIENTDDVSGQECLNYIHDNFPQYLEKIGRYDMSMNIGNPQGYVYALCAPNELYFKTVSPTTLRYIMHLGQIEKWFGPLDNLVIGEIGAGYGGLCTIIHEYFNSKEYILFDLPEVMEFQVKYIKKFNPEIIVNKAYNDDTHVWKPIKPYSKKKMQLDLILAFCSWSELDIDLKIDYLKNVIRHAKKGVIAINYDFEENVQLIKDTLTDKKIDIRVPGFILTFE
jgi:putative sugar O-methyltransferase